MAETRHIIELPLYREMMAAMGAITVASAVASLLNRDIVSAGISGIIGYNLSHDYVDWHGPHAGTSGDS